MQELDRLAEALLAGSLDSVLLINGTGGILQANAVAQRWLGTSGGPTPSLFEWITPSFDLESFWRTLAEKGSFRAEVTWVPSYGDPGLAHLIATRLTADRHLVILQRTTEDPLRKDWEAAYQAWMKGVPALLIQMQRDGTILRVLKGLSIEDEASRSFTSGSSIFQVFPSDRAAQHMRYVQLVLNTGVPKRYTYRIEDPSGSRYEEAHITVSGPDEVVVVLQDVTEQKRTEEALRLQAQQEQVLGSMLQNMRRSLNIIEILFNAVTDLRRVLQTDRVLVYRFAQGSGGSVITESVSPPFPSLLGMSLPDDLWNLDLRQSLGAVWAFPRMSAPSPHHSVQETATEWFRPWRVQAQLVTMIAVGELGWGLLIVQHCQEPRSWLPYETELLQKISDQVSIAIQQALLYEQVQILNTQLEAQVQQRTQQLQRALQFEAFLKRISDQVRDGLDETHILETVVQEVGRFLQVYSCDTAFYDYEKGISTIHFEYVNGELHFAKGQTLEMGNYPDLYEQLCKGQTLQMCWAQTLKQLREVGTRFVTLCCPLMDDQGVIGDMWLYRSREDFFDESEVRLIQQVANQSAIAIRQARLYQSAQHQIQELIYLNQLKDDFVSTVSHELRTPLTNLNIGIHMLKISQDQAPFTPRQAQYLNMLEQECRREIALVNDLLNLQKLEAEAYNLRFEVLDPLTWIPQMIHPFLSRIQEENQQLRVEISPFLPSIITDRTCLERIVQELLNNACKYTTPGGEIAIRATIQELRFALQISNTGSISRGELPRLFDRFYRVPQGDRWKQGGTGLGLALVKQMVNLLQGTVEVSSSNGWISFLVTLPLELAPPQSATLATLPVTIPD